MKQASGMTYRQRANMILLLSAVLYGVVFVGQFYVQADWYGALYWVTQSALIGSVADWFAVTALFRRPLGFPWHTALIPRNKGRLIDGIVNMVETRLLTVEQWGRLLEEVHFIPALDRWLTSEKGRQTLRELISQVLLYVRDRQDPQALAGTGAKMLRRLLAEQQITPQVKRVLGDLLTADHHNQVWEQLLEVLRGRLEDPAIRRFIESSIQQVVDERKHGFRGLLLELAESLDWISAPDMAEAVQAELSRLLEAWKNPHDPGRTACMEQWRKQVDNLRSDSRESWYMESSYQDWLKSLPLKDMLLTYVWPAVEKLVTPGEEGVSDSAVQIEDRLHELWVAHSGDAGVRDRLEASLHDICLTLLTEAHGLIGVIVRQVLGGLTDERFNYFIESKVEEDLSWIRINGALVGAVIGLVVWTFLHVIYEPWAVPLLRDMFGL